MSAFTDQLKMFRGEQEAAQQYFFTFLALNNIPAASERILHALNQTPQFWIVARHASLVTTIVSLGRIFDNANYSVGRLFTETSNDLAVFAQAALAARKLAEGLSPTAAADFAATAHVLSAADIREMKKAIKPHRAIWEGSLSEVRNKVLAHREISHADADALYATVDVGQVVNILGCLAALHEALWQAFHNGRKPDLTAQGPLFPITDVGQEPGERVYRQVSAALESLAKGYD
jgi:hypothetical protein